MPGVVMVQLPDGSSKELPRGATALDLAESIGRRLAKDAVAARLDGREVDLSTELPDGAVVSIVTSSSEEGRAVLRHSSAHVLAQAVLRLWPGAHYAIGPVIENGFYYDFELPGGASFSDDDLVRIEAVMREIMAEDQPFIRHEHTIEEGLELFDDQPFKVEIIEAVGAGSRRSTPTRTPPTRWCRPTGTRPPSPTCAAARTCPPPLGSGTSSSCAWPAPTGVATSTAPSSSASTAPPSSPKRRSPSTWNGSRRPNAGPPQARRGARPVLLPRGDRFGARRLSPEGWHHPAPHGGLLAPAPRGGRLRVRELAAHLEGPALRDLRAPRLVRRRHVPPDGARRGPAVLPQAHELPVPHPDLQGTAAGPTRAAHAPLRIRDGLPLREVGCRARPDPGARHDPGRRPHLLQP